MGETHALCRFPKNVNLDLRSQAGRKGPKAIVRDVKWGQVEHHASAQVIFCCLLQVQEPKFRHAPSANVGIAVQVEGDTFTVI